MGSRGRAAGDLPPEVQEGDLCSAGTERSHTITFQMEMEGKPDLTLDLKDMLRFIALCRAMKMADEGTEEGDDHKRSSADEMAMIALYAYNPPPKDERQWYINCFHHDPWAPDEG